MVLLAAEAIYRILRALRRLVPGVPGIAEASESRESALTTEHIRPDTEGWSLRKSRKDDTLGSFKI